MGSQCGPLCASSSSELIPCGVWPSYLLCALLTAYPPVVRYCLFSERGSNCPHHRAKRSGPVGCRKLPQFQQALRGSVHSPQAAYPDHLSELRARCQCLPHFTEEATEVKDDPYTFPRIRNDQKCICSWSKRRAQLRTCKWPEVADASRRGQQDPSAKHLLLHSSFLLRPLLHASWTLAS